LAGLNSDEGVQLEREVKKGELEHLKEVVRKVFEYTPPAKDAGRKHVLREREVKHRRCEWAGKESARSS